MTVRPATPDDVATMHRMVLALAAYEREPDAVEATEDDLRGALFGTEPRAWAHVADTASGEVVGFALWFVTYSTWTGRHGIWLEDLFVLPEHRGAGHGRALLDALAAVCAERGWRRLEWNVLDWNEPALRFYRLIGARALDEWTVHRLDIEHPDH